MQHRRLVLICASGTVIFIACYAVAIALYPGGTWYDANAVGHSWSKNFLCDLMQTRALNGDPAPVGSVFARLGMVVMWGALAAFYELIARFEEPRSRAGRVAKVAGIVAAVMGLTIPIATSDQFRFLHLVSVVAAFLPSLVASGAAFVICLRTPKIPAVRAFAVLTIGAGVIDGLLYGFVYASPELGLVPESAATRKLISASLPLFQRVATFALLGWVAAVCARAWPRSPAS